MTQLKVKQFGAIKDGYPQNDGFFDIPKVTVFVGNQGSGKSTVAKLISTFSWMEKVLVRGDYTKDWFIKNGNFKDTYLAYHRIQNYFRDNSDVSYTGSAYAISYTKGNLTIDEQKNAGYELPQIMYIPAERSFLASVEDPQKYKDISEPLVEFLSEYTKARDALSKPKRLPINDAVVEYDQNAGTVYIKGSGYRIKLLESSSGFQSAVPLFLVSSYLCGSVKNAKTSDGMSSAEKSRFSRMTSEILSDDNLTDRQKRIAISEIGKKFNKTVFVNIVEEPEQNLFPVSQWHIFQDLLSINNAIDGNKLVVTTHSPYFINYLTLAIKAHSLKSQSGKPETDTELKRMGFQPESLVVPGSAAIYELSEIDGTINPLDMPNGLPSDDNRLNRELGGTNELFAKLLEIQQCL